MKGPRCLVVRGPGDLVGLSEHDRTDVERFTDFIRRVHRATDAGVPHVEAAAAIYPDVYPDGEASSEPEGGA